MALKAFLIGEREDIRRSVFMPPGAVLQLPSSEDASYRCMGFIDQYGHTVFNRLQMPILMTELERLEKNTIDMGARKFLREVHEIAAQCLRGIHLYVKFMGD